MAIERTRSDPVPTFLTIPEIGEICRVSAKTVRRWIESGELPAHRFGRQWRIRLEDFQIFIKLRRN